ncbi:MAG: hypothetical protein QQW96_16965 [Tychonema bourrellyi B0820]|uniref:DUF4276 domain-containing protein n=1 Tax=Tychonema bourrellyi FEM_GT703 TaxID=2040638 RepID=A0A2G4F011_9CYAN|nr:hypothetical protein [Tychonema bourrellyi]MDQ2099323.1 hypothetical protein [Tychonema bourrellyi B0820]PHX55102.1 hypothetical protein CP500_012570 [Tychonema bourrellyi FEM_GT703]
MNLYFLVEGTQSERKVYPAWLAHLLPELQRVQSCDDVNEKNYYLISGEGYPSLIYDFIPRAIAEINSNGKYSYFVVCLDAEENTVAELTTEIDNFLDEQKLKLNNAELMLIFQNRCLESWLLGNRKIYSRNPQDKPLLDYTKYYDVSVNCPENMGKYQEFNTHAQFHGAYLRSLFEAKNITYSKKRPGDVLKPFYLEQLLARIQVQPEQLTTFRQFIDFCNKIQPKLQN